jgi:hypothetical protein
VRREEAEGLFASWDTSSEVATPRASETGHSPALTPSLQHSRMDTLSPGALDDSNFPSLGRQLSSKVVVAFPDHSHPKSGIATTSGTRLGRAILEVCPEGLLCFHPVSALGLEPCKGLVRMFYLNATLNVSLLDPYSGGGSPSTSRFTLNLNLM